LAASLLVALGAQYSGLGRAFASGSAQLWINPATSHIGNGSSGMVDIEINNASGAYGIQLEMSYDPALLQIVDADGAASGVQIEPRDCPDAEYTVQNSADNGSGLLDFAVSQLYPKAGCSSGTLATIEFQCIGNGTTAVEIQNSILASAGGQAIDHTIVDAEVICSASPPAPAQVYIDPASDVGSMDVFTSSVQISDASDLYGVELRLSFDSSILQVIDVDTTAAGIQVSSGDCPQADFSVLNVVDNAGGTIDYVVSQLNPTPGCSGGQTLEIEFQCSGIGTSPLIFTQTILADSAGQAINFENTNGSITCDEMGIYLPLLVENGPLR
jgi:hypothetical protein